MAKLFQWDAQESKGSDTPQGFSKYLFDLYMSDVANGWSISEEVDPFKLLPLQAQEWYWGLYSYNRTLLHDCHRDDERYPELEFADFLNEIYNDNDQREDWETATPESQDPATSTKHVGELQTRSSVYNSARSSTPERNDEPTFIMAVEEIVCRYLSQHFLRTQG